MEKETIALTDITVDLRLNIRESLDDETIKRYTENFEQLPPAVVFESDDTYLLADGFHRYEAANKLGRDEIEVEVRHGTRQDAEEYAALANLKHGKPLTRKERRKAVERMLMLHSERANAWIAEDTGVSKNTVAKYREELESKCQIDRCSTFRTKDGREFPREIKQPS
ncbi:MAG: ParB/RepB/Spo0J family partition protein, partial [bacterium]